MPIDLHSLIRDVPNFPKAGIIFKDITTLLKDGPSFVESVEILADYGKDRSPEAVIGVESRGFILGAAVAYKLGIGFIPIRKPGKLPAETISAEYALEYGTDCIEIHRDAVESGSRILLIDDLLATGGTARTAARLVEMLEGTIVGMGFLVELGFLKGRKKLSKYDLFSIILCEED
jgi:adenine phosphoribosyltransferase